jgi:hypothetical protein
MAAQELKEPSDEASAPHIGRRADAEYPARVSLRNFAGALNRDEKSG